MVAAEQGFSRASTYQPLIWMLGKGWESKLHPFLAYQQIPESTGLSSILHVSESHIVLVRWRLKG